MIVVYGATGTTGTLVAEELCRRGFDLVLAGRDRGRLSDLAKKLGGLPIRQAQVHDAAALEEAVAGAAVVVSCAGPFLVVGEPVLRAAIAAGAHYLDCSGEQAFVREAYERYDSRARKAGVSAVPGFGFEVALGDWAAGRAAALVRIAAEVAESEPIEEVAIGYAVAGFRPSGGTVQSAVAALARPAVVWQEDRWERASAGLAGAYLRVPAALRLPRGGQVSLGRGGDGSAPRGSPPGRDLHLAR
jgi:short subunit dehydrogenase-like uncharacterized protein